MPPINKHYLKKPTKQSVSHTTARNRTHFLLISPPAFPEHCWEKTSQPVPTSGQTHQTFIHWNHMLWPSEQQYLIVLSCKTLWQCHNSSHHCWHSVGTIHSGRVKTGLTKDCSGMLLSSSIEINQLKVPGFQNSTYWVSLWFLVPILEYFKERFSKGELSAAPT